MRKRCFLFFIVLICGFFFLACSSQEKRLKELWKLEKDIKYHNFTISEKEKTYKLLKCFSQEEKYNKDSWNSGYSQQCFVLRRLYFEELISKEDFLNQCVSIYERYENNNNIITFHTTGYAVCLYYLGETQKARNIFIQILKKASEKEFASKNNYDISLFICRKLLNIYDESDNDDLYSNLNEEDIINIFCGN